MNLTRPPLDSLACVNCECSLYAQAGKENLVIRKTYGAEEIRYLRCRRCGTEFSERKHSALWNVKIPEARAIAISEQLAERTSIKGTARLIRSHPESVRRLALRSGPTMTVEYDLVIIGGGLPDAMPPLPLPKMSRGTTKVLP